MKTFLRGRERCFVLDTKERGQLGQAVKGLSVAVCTVNKDAEDLEREAVKEKGQVLSLLPWQAPQLGSLDRAYQAVPQMGSDLLTVVTLQITPFFWWWTTVFVSVPEILLHTTGTSIRSTWWVSIAQALVIHQTHKTHKLNSKTGWKGKEKSGWAPQHFESVSHCCLLPMEGLAPQEKLFLINVAAEHRGLL